MSEKKEKQYAVLFYDKFHNLSRIIWWDARADARAAAKAFNERPRGRAYAMVKQMTRGDGA